MGELEQLEDRIKELTNWQFVRQPRIVTDTSDCMRIERGDVVRLEGHDYVIEGNRYETRFGISDQPKYWVFGAIDIENGRKKIIKAVFHEDFNVHIGVLKVHCYRSPKKEADVLKLVQGDRRFMQGIALFDSMENNTRIIDFIRGETIFNYIGNIKKDHEQYYHEDLPGILLRLLGSMEAIAFLHENGTCHGDIRNDHIIIETDSGDYRWIDFDLNQHVSDFDIWSMGNIISYAAGQGIRSFRHILKDRRFSEEVRQSLCVEDASAFYEYRIINLKKIFPYISERLNNILMHFAIRPTGSYEKMGQLIGDFRETLAVDFPDADRNTG